MLGDKYREWIRSGIALKGDALSEAYDDRIEELEAIMSNAAEMLEKGYSPVSVAVLLRSAFEGDF